MRGRSFNRGRSRGPAGAAAILAAALSLPAVFFGCAEATRSFSGSEGGAGGEGGSGCGAGSVFCGGKCVDTKTDEAHCGGCGKACAAGEVCTGGSCAGGCAGGTTKCGAACVNTSIDSAHCGGCDSACAPGEACTAGMCGPKCMSGAVMCSGVCTDTSSDPMNCGGCGEVCSPDAACEAGACGPACKPGSVMCSGMCADLATDPKNCGACGSACAPGEGCAEGKCSQCSGGAVLQSVAPSGTMVLCDDPNNMVCEENYETLCPPGWGLCTYLQHKERSAGWSYMILLPSVVAVGEIYCRAGGDAGHFTLPDISGMPTTLGGPASINCYYGSSRPACVTQYGCNEQYAMALCCAPTPTCGNGLVDSPEEDCDDGNPDETDDCLSSCAWRVPGAHGYVGTSCN